ncbi:flagellar biosynthetic protein FliR [Verticiella sediminum]|uniref:Flagellar biosynthetic protein FliR n=1 Tax=Verticiella sediminum TaxID=1247510 RepID=A0A556ART5_9BURK|nr:flagellar biosynthetic protein FliR [Verticiella sediminum]TSH95671.1 flagellar biosynthetic protein FliR [Verticiella sediminum]
MITFTLEQWYAWINGLFWPLARILALFMVAPLFSENSVPTRARLGLGILLGIAIAPMAGPLPDVPPASWAGLWILAQQILIGLALGLCLRMALAVVQTAGEFVGLQMGLSFATFFEPGTNAQTSVLSRLFYWIALLVFIALDGHLLLLAALVHTFEVLPIADARLGAGGPGALIDWSAQVMTLGLVLSLPLVTALLTMNLSMGILNRTAPQLSVFAVGFPLSLLAGLVMLTIVLPQTTPFLERLFADAYMAFERIVLGFRP